MVVNSRNILQLIKVMQRRGLGVTEKLLQKTIEETAEARHKSRVASLAPYIAEIERRKKQRTFSKKSKKNLNLSSQKSFRIKEKSTLSLQKQVSQQIREMTTNNLVARLLEQRGNRERRAKSVQRHHENNTVESPSSNNFFNDLYVKVKNKLQKQRPPRKKQYQTLQNQRVRSQQAGEVNIHKLAFTNVAQINNEGAKKKEQRKGNFRRNKYQFLNSSLIDQPRKECKAEQVQSDSRIELDKKESNVSINKEMDRLAEREMVQFYRQVCNKEIHKSVDRTTEKYFKYESYRPAKSKNDIEAFINTVKNPSVNKKSHSTTDQQQPAPPPKTSGQLLYDFDFNNNEEQPGYPRINEMENPSQQESSLQICAGNESQKLQVLPADWSEDECKVDEL